MKRKKNAAFDHILVKDRIICFLKFIIEPVPLPQYIFSVWIDKPTVTGIDSINSPIETLTFPTITLCPKNPNPDRWGPAIKLFDHMKQKCNLNQ